MTALEQVAIVVALCSLGGWAWALWLLRRSTNDLQEAVWILERWKRVADEWRDLAQDKKP